MCGCELKHCPFCDYPLIVIESFMGGIPIFYHGMCPNCGRRGPLSDSREEAYESFYKRFKSEGDKE